MSLNVSDVLGQISAEFRDYEARLKGLALTKEAMETAMAESRAKFQEESDAFAGKKAEFEASLKKAAEDHAASIKQREEAIVKMVERAQDRANALINEAKAEIKKKALDAQANLDDLTTRGSAASRQLAVLTIEIEEKTGVLAEIHQKLAAISKQSA